MKLTALNSLLFIVLGMVLLSAPVYANAQVSTVQVLRTTLTGDDTKQVLITSGEFAPGVTLPHHKHPGDDYTVVRQGTLELHVEGREPQRVSAGQAFHVPPETVHYVRVLGDTPVRIVAFWVLDKGKQPMQVVPE
jgi:quercetin dioxygenase-like cupin family protein